MKKKQIAFLITMLSDKKEDLLQVLFETQDHDAQNNILADIMMCNDCISELQIMYSD